MQSPWELPEGGVLLGRGLKHFKYKNCKDMARRVLSGLLPAQNYVASQEQGGTMAGLHPLEKQGTSSCTRLLSTTNACTIWGPLGTHFLVARPRVVGSCSERALGQLSLVAFAV